MVHKKNFTNYYSLCCFIFLFLFVIGEVRSQVTIGSTLKPKPGSLLDLKQDDNQDANSAKGLMLPRVSLTDFNKLYPMLEADIDYTTSTTEQQKQDQLHIGLIVYNTNKCFGTEGTGKGIYTWTGSDWVALFNKSVSPSASINVNNDQDGNTFYSGQFGVAGEWMLTNLRVNTYSDGTSLGTASIGTDNTARWNYPNFDKVAFEKQPQRGYLYNWYAATNKSQSSGIDEGAGTTQVETGDRGICPIGWHLPSDIEWTTFEKFIITNPSLYSNMPATALPDFDATDTGYRGKHAKALIASCLPYELAGNSNGLSFNAKQQGFAALLTGFAENGAIKGFGEQAAFWTVSSKDNGTAWHRLFDNSNDGVQRDASSLSNMLAVRCKKTEEFKVCGDPLTDQDNNVYQTADFGSAGCWMTTNLRSTKNQIVTLTEGTNSMNAQQQLVYAKPNSTDNDPQKGYLYTWDAALAGTNANETLLPNEAGSVVSKLQGICPAGWVIPSDKDWSLLEKEIYENPQVYSTTTTIGTWLPTYEIQTGWRPGDESGWGVSLKVPASNGTSKPSKGMNVLMAGALESGLGQQFGLNAYFWTSNDLFTAIGGDAKANYRALAKDSKDMYRGGASKSSMLSVRCKKL